KNPPLEPRLPPAGTPAKRVRGRRPHALTRAAPPTSALEPSEVDVAAGSVDTQLVQPAPSHVEAPPVAPPAATAQKQTEAELLFAARRQIRRDPRAALRLVDEHVARFPDGLLAPEREVLAIEALRQLGQTAAAARRLQLFRARYPDSLHLRRLDRQAE
ncbi:MAG: hypothetical protein JWN04_327, partial [Myxococcaceae bacterium]|nr:hypothetical protein [Myxococcaceae bacterium]